MAWLTVSVHKAIYSCITKHLYGSIRETVSLLCLFVHEPPYQTTVVCYNFVFHCSSLHMDHHANFHITVGLSEAQPNSILQTQLHPPQKVTEFAKRVLYTHPSFEL